MTTDQIHKAYTEQLVEIENLKRKLALYEGTFRGVEVRVGDYWYAAPGYTTGQYEHDEPGMIVGIEVDETGRKLLHLSNYGEGFSMYEDGRF